MRGALTTNVVSVISEPIHLPHTVRDEYSCHLILSPVPSLVELGADPDRTGPDGLAAYGKPLVKADLLTHQDQGIERVLCEQNRNLTVLVFYALSYSSFPCFCIGENFSHH